MKLCKSWIHNGVAKVSEKFHPVHGVAWILSFTEWQLDLKKRCLFLSKILMLLKMEEIKDHEKNIYLKGIRSF